MAITQGGAGSSGGSGGGPATLAAGSVSAGAYVLGSVLDGAIVTLGALGDTAVGDAAGSLNAHTRQIAKLLGAGITLGAGAAVIGAVTQSGTWNVSVNTALPAGSNSIGTVILGAGAAVVGAVTQSGSWTVTANAGSGTFTVGGTVTVNAGTGTFPMQTAAAAPGSVELSDGAAFYTAAKTGQLPAALVGGRLSVDGSGVTQPVSGTVTITPSGTQTVSGTVTSNQGTQNGAGTASWNVQGAVAQNVVGLSTVNPLAIGGMALDGSTARMATISNTSSDGASNGPLPLVVQPLQVLYNGATWDRQRNNADVTLLSSAARTTLQNSANILTYNCRAIIVTLDLTASGGAISLTPSINYIDPASGKTIPLLTATTIAATGTFTYWVNMNAIVGTPAPFTKTVQADIGRVITINVAVGNANSQTYSVGYTLIPA